MHNKLKIIIPTIFILISSISLGANVQVCNLSNNAVNIKALWCGATCGLNILKGMEKFDASTQANQTNVPAKNYQVVPK